MRIITFNANGIRSAASKGFFTWVLTQNIDVICIQETKAQEHQIAALAKLPGYQSYFFDAEKKGYSGVAIYTRRKPDKVSTGLGFATADKEGRYIQADFGNLSIVSLYLPSGTSGDERQAVKYDFLDHFMVHLKKMREDGREYIVCGDWNIAHKPIDLKNWKSNQKNSGFLPEERAWLDKLFDEVGYVDAFREVNTQPDQYTWWSHFAKARDRNVGWRIDYHIITPGLKNTIKSAEIYTRERFSDHAPVMMEYEIS